MSHRSRPFGLQHGVAFVHHDRSAGCDRRETVEMNGLRPAIHRDDAILKSNHLFKQRGHGVGDADRSGWKIRVVRRDLDSNELSVAAQSFAVKIFVERLGINIHLEFSSMPCPTYAIAARHWFTRADISPKEAGGAKGFPQSRQPIHDSPPNPIATGQYDPRSIDGPRDDIDHRGERGVVQVQTHGHRRGVATTPPTIAPLPFRSAWHPREPKPRGQRRRIRRFVGGHSD